MGLAHGPLERPRTEKESVAHRVVDCCGMKPHPRLPATLFMTTAVAVGLGCAAEGQKRFWRDREGRVIVEGPMLGPAESLESLAPKLCAEVRALPGATAGHRRGGQEYCGAIYQRPGDNRFFASYPSYLGPPLELPQGRKSCYPPSEVHDAVVPRTSIFADYHSHPSATTFSPDDLKTSRQRFYFRVMFNSICEVFLYDFQGRAISRLQEGRFMPIGSASDEVVGE